MQMSLQPEPNLKQRLAQRLYDVIFIKDPDFAECLMGFAMLAWGLQLLAPWQTFSPSSPSFMVLAGIWPYTEQGWGLMFALFGAAKLAGYFFDLWWLRLPASLAVSSGWAFVAGAFGYANPTGTGVIAYAVFSIISSWVFWRLVREVMLR